jgi:hypothetical protein
MCWSEVVQGVVEIDQRDWTPSSLAELRAFLTPHNGGLEIAFPSRSGANSRALDPMFAVIPAEATALLKPHSTGSLTT